MNTSENGRRKARDRIRSTKCYMIHSPLLKKETRLGDLARRAHRRVKKSTEEEEVQFCVESYMLRSMDTQKDSCCPYLYMSIKIHAT